MDPVGCVVILSRINGASDLLFECVMFILVFFFCLYLICLCGYVSGIFSTGLKMPLDFKVMTVSIVNSSANYPLTYLTTPLQIFVIYSNRTAN